MPEKMDRLLKAFHLQSTNLEAGQHHTDIPLSMDVQKDLLARAGFTEIHKIYQESENVILTARRVA